MIEIIDNFLPSKFIDNIEKLFFYHKPGEVAFINWHYNHKTLSTSYKVDQPDTYQFTHNFYHKNKINSPFFPNVFHILKKSKIKYSDIVRIKANFTANNFNINEKNSLIPPHTDIILSNKNKFISMIYYVHDTDGDTIFFDNDKKTIIKRVTPKKGKAVIFYSNQFHSFETPIEYDKRVVINFMVKASF